jgi:TldD protein
MKRSSRFSLAFAGLLGSAGLLLSQAAQPPLPNDEVLLRAMRDEMARVPQLAIVGGKDAPYFTSYTISDADSFRVGSVLGATVQASRNQFRAPSIEVRVGDYAYDHTGHVQSGAYSGTRLDGDWPLDANYPGLRSSLWLGTDVAFKAALESISRKRASQANAAAEATPLANFTKADPVVSIPKLTFDKLDETKWTSLANRLSSIFKKYPEVLISGVDIQAMTGFTTMLTSEGTMIRYEDGIAWASGKAESMAKDGMVVHDAASLQGLKLSTLPAEADLIKGFTEVADNVRALAAAPAAEAYTGPVLFEPRAAAQLLAQLLGDNLRLNRRPLTNPGQSVNIAPSELESRLNARVLPDFFDVTDDSTLATYNGKPLVGFYEYDLEGLRPKPVNVIEKGVLKNFLTTRTPATGFPASNGHARFPGNFGSRAAATGNLFVKANESTPLAGLKQRLITMIGTLNKPYGLIVRKLDFPFSGTTGELQALAQANAQSGGGARPVAPPILVYRVYPDGREELVRGLRFRGLTTRTLRDILAASQETTVFEFVNTTAPLAMLGSGGYLSPVSVVAPGLLFEEIEFETPREQLSKPPLVPAPPLNP